MHRSDWEINEDESDIVGTAREDLCCKFQAKQESGGDRRGRRDGWNRTRTPEIGKGHVTSSPTPPRPLAASWPARMRSIMGKFKHGATIEDQAGITSSYIWTFRLRTHEGWRHSTRTYSLGTVRLVLGGDVAPISVPSPNLEGFSRPCAKVLAQGLGARSWPPSQNLPGRTEDTIFISPGFMVGTLSESLVIYCAPLVSQANVIQGLHYCLAPDPTTPTRAFIKHERSFRASSYRLLAITSIAREIGSDYLQVCFFSNPRYFSLTQSPTPHSFCRISPTGFAPPLSASSPL